MILVPEVQNEKTRICLKFDDDMEPSIEKSSGEISLEGTQIGRIREADASFHLETEQPLPALQWLTVLAVYADVRSAENMRRPAR